MNDNSHLPQTPTPIQFSDFVCLSPFIGKFMINACTVLCLFAANVLKLFGTNIVHIVPQASPSYIPYVISTPILYSYGVQFVHFNIMLQYQQLLH
jgi:hypothetical protein